MSLNFNLQDGTQVSLTYSTDGIIWEFDVSLNGIVVRSSRDAIPYTLKAISYFVGLNLWDIANNTFLSLSNAQVVSNLWSYWSTTGVSDLQNYLNGIIPNLSNSAQVPQSFALGNNYAILFNGNLSVSGNSGSIVCTAINQ